MRGAGCGGLTGRVSDSIFCGCCEMLMTGTKLVLDGPDSGTCLLERFLRTTN